MWTGPTLTSSPLSSSHSPSPFPSSSYLSFSQIQDPFSGFDKIPNYWKHTHLNSSKGYPYLSSKPPLFSLRHSDSPNFRSSLSSASYDSVPAESAAGDSTSAVPAKDYTYVDDDPFQVGNFVTDELIEKRKALESFVYFHELESGLMWVRAMRPEDEEWTILTGASAVGSIVAIPAILKHAGVISWGALTMELSSFFVFLLAIMCYIRTSNDDYISI